MSITARVAWSCVTLLLAGFNAVSPAAARKHVVPPPPAIAPVPSDPQATLALIDAAIADHRTSAAQSMIGGARGRVPEAELSLRLAECALEAGSLDEAVASFGKLAADPVVGARALQGLGVAELRREDNGAAIQALDRALTRDPRLVRAWIARGVAADRARDWVRADDAYGHAVALDPTSDAALANRGYSRLLRGAYLEAVTDLEAALAIRPTLAVARNNLRLAEALTGNYKAAFKGSNKATLSRDLNMIGFAAMARGDYSVAETMFDRAMELDPEFDHVAWENLQYLKQLTRSTDPAMRAP